MHAESKAVSAPASDAKKRNGISDRLRATEDALREARSMIAEQERRERELKKLLAGSSQSCEASPDPPRAQPRSVHSTKTDAFHDAQLEAMKTVHDTKVRALMKSIHQLQEQIQSLKSQDKEHRRSALIQNLRQSQREQELLLDVLKQTMVEKMPEFHGSRELVNDFILKKSVGGPLRFRPPSREELENELDVLNSKYKRAVENLKKAKEEHTRGPEPSGPATKRQNESPTDEDHDRESTRLSTGRSRAPLIEKEVLVIDPAQQEEIDRLQVELASKNLTIPAQADELYELQAEIERLQVVEAKLEHKKERISYLEEKLAKFQQENAQLVQEKEAQSDTCSQLLEEIQFLRDSRIGDVHASDSERLRQLELIESLRAREAELQREIEDQQRKWSVDRSSMNQQARLQEKEIQLLQEQLQQLQHDVVALQKKHDRLFVESEGAKSRLNEATAENESLRSRMQELEGTVALRESLAREECGTQTQSLEARVRELESALAEKDELAKRLDRQLTASKLLGRQAKKEKELLQERLNKLHEEARA